MITIFNKSLKKSSPSALIAKAVKADGVIGDIEIILLRKPALGLADEFKLIIEKLRIIDDRLATETDKVMMVLLPIRIIHELVPGLAVAEIELLNHAHLRQHVQGTIHRGESDRRVDLMGLDIHVGGAHVIVGFVEHIDHDLAGRCHARPDIVEPVLPPRSSSMSFASQFTLAILIENDFHYQYTKNNTVRQVFNELLLKYFYATGAAHSRYMRHSGGFCWKIVLAPRRGPPVLARSFKNV